MPSHALTLTYATRTTARSPLDLLQIEQDDWATATGVVTSAAMVRRLSAILYDEDRRDELRLDCGMAGDSVRCLVRVWPLVPGLVYRFATSHGTLSERLVEEISETEDVFFQLSTTEQVRHPVRSIESVEWLADCYDADGAIVAPPALSASGQEVTSGRPVYGTARVIYTTERHTYALTCPRREGALANFYTAAVYGVYAGGLNWLEIDMPPGIEEFEQDPDADCGWGSAGGSIDWPEDEPYPVEESNRTRITVVDYCSQEVASDRIY